MIRGEPSLFSGIRYRVVLTIFLSTKTRIQTIAPFTLNTHTLDRKKHSKLIIRRSLQWGSAFFIKKSRILIAGHREGQGYRPCGLFRVVAGAGVICQAGLLLWFNSPRKKRYSDHTCLAVRFHCAPFELLKGMFTILLSHPG